VSELGWLDSALTAARPQALGALLRYFRNLDRAEEAYQEACLRALRNWPVNGPPRDPAAWLIFVGRNAALDQVRRESSEEPLPPEELISDRDDAETALAERLDNSHYRDDVLRLLFICCHPELPATQQIALALRIVSGLSVKEIARAFLVSESAMEQRITRAKRRVAGAQVQFETPGAIERAQRVAAVAAMIYLLFNEGYSASGGDAHIRVPLCEEAIRLARLLLRLFPGEPEIMGLTALLLLQHGRARARLDAEGCIVLMEDQDRTLWDGAMMAEGLVLVEKALRHRRPGAYQVQAAVAAVHAVAARFEDTEAARRRSGACHDRAAGRAALGLFPLLRRQGCAAAGAWPRRGGARGVRPGHRARPHTGRSRAHPAASRPPDEGQHAARQHQGRHLTSEILRRAVGLASCRASLERSIERMLSGGRTMKYLCLVYGEEKVLDALSKDDMGVLVDESLAYDDVLRKSGHYLVSEALQPVEAAKTVRIRNRETFITDGPFAETKEQLLGFILIDARDLDEAVQVAAKIPLASTGSIEIRPVLQLEPLQMRRIG